jgi:hypothetical protein
MSSPNSSAWLERARPVLIALSAGIAYGGWASFVHGDHGLSVALRAGLTQATLSLTATLVMALLLERLFRLPSNPVRGFWLAFLVTVNLSAAWLTVGHLLMGTPHVLAAMAPSVIVGTALYFAYARMLLFRARKARDRGVRGSLHPARNVPSPTVSLAGVA